MAGTISVEELARLRETGAPHALLDVREKGEFVQQHIFRAVPIPRGLIELRVPQRIQDRSVPVVIYDDDGHRARLAAERLEEMGYGEVRVLDGGLEAWMVEGRRTDYGTNVPGKDYGEKVAVQRRTPQLTPDQIVERQQRGEHVVVLDSRTREEYERSHLPGAYCVPGGELPLRIQTLLDAPEYRDATLVVNCAGRTRSILGADVLIRMGVENPVFALENGTMAWAMAGYDLESGPGADVAPADSAEASETARAFARRLAKEDDVEVIDFARFQELMGETQLLYVLDVRLPEEYDQGHIPGSVSLPAGQLALAADEIVAVNQAPIVLVSNSGVRARIAGSIARQMEYLHVLVLDGGIGAWRAAGNALESALPEFEVPGIGEARATTSSMTPQELHDLLESNDPPLVVDVKGSGDFALSHIEGSRWVPRGDIERRLERYATGKDQAIVLTCDSGVRSALAAWTVQELGYTNVRWLEDGLGSWRAAGYETVQGLEGADVSIREAKDDVEMIGRVGPLARSRQDMIDYLEWEIELGHKYETAG